MRYEVETHIASAELLERARRHFTGAGLELTGQGLNRMTFTGAEGHVVLIARRFLDRTRVEIEAYQLDREAEAFIASLPGPPGPLRRAWDRWRKRR